MPSTNDAVRIQPWVNHWPENAKHTLPQSQSQSQSQDGGVHKRTYLAYAQKGAQPKDASCTDGTKVMRLDTVESFLTALK